MQQHLLLQTACCAVFKVFCEMSIKAAVIARLSPGSGIYGPEKLPDRWPGIILSMPTVMYVAVA